jgi:hypothetical protein
MLMLDIAVVNNAAAEIALSTTTNTEKGSP